MRAKAHESKIKWLEPYLEMSSNLLISTTTRRERLMSPTNHRTTVIDRNSPTVEPTTFRTP